MSKHWLQVAVLIAIVLTALVTTTTVAVVGISPIGDLALTGDTSLTMNATMWSTYASLGSTFVLILVLGIVGLSTFFLIACIQSFRGGDSI